MPDLKSLNIQNDKVYFHWPHITTGYEIVEGNDGQRYVDVKDNCELNCLFQDLGIVFASFQCLKWEYTAFKLIDLVEYCIDEEIALIDGRN